MVGSIETQVYEGQYGKWMRACEGQQLLGGRNRGMVESVQRKKIKTNRELMAFDENREKTQEIEGQYKGDEQ